MDDLQNPNPTIFKKKKIDEETKLSRKLKELDPEIEDEIDNLEGK